MEKNRHYIQLYYGMGKGKTTAALGMSIRAVGQGQKVVFLQWLKGRSDIGEMKIADQLKPNFSIRQFGPDYFTWEAEKDDTVHRDLAMEGLKFLEQLIERDEYDVLVLDELMDAVSMKFLDLEKVIELIKKAVTKGEVVITGHALIPDFAEAADLITEMKKEKHYFDNGQAARVGIEF